MWLEPAFLVLFLIFQSWYIVQTSFAHHESLVISLTMLLQQDAYPLRLLDVDSRWRLASGVERQLSREQGSMPAQKSIWISSSRDANPEGRGCMLGTLTFKNSLFPLSICNELFFLLKVNSNFIRMSIPKQGPITPSYQSIQNWQLLNAGAGPSMGMRFPKGLFPVQQEKEAEHKL